MTDGSGTREYAGRGGSRIVVGLDIGTTKISTVIGEVGSDGVLDIIGEGSVPSEGLRRGAVVNLEKTINSIRNSVSAAERVAGVRVLDAYVGVAGSHIKALTSHGLAAIRRNQEISRSDVDRAIENARAVPLDPNLEVVHVLPQEYVVDGQEGIKDPVGMHGVRLEVDVHIVTGMQGPLANLRRCATEAALTVNSLVLQGYASGLAVLEPAEEDVTTVVLDIGGGTTDVGVFRRGNLAFSAVVPLGGDHITSDLAQILKIPSDEAERVKKKYGSAVPEMADQELTLELTQGGVVTSVSAFELSRIIKPRVAEIFNLVRHEVDTALGPVELIAGGIVLTGGTSLMRGIVELARERFKLPVRLGKPRGMSGLSDVVSSPIHATAVGLVRYGISQDMGRGATHIMPETRELVPVAQGSGEAGYNSEFEALEPHLEPHMKPMRPMREPRPAGPSLWERIRSIFKEFF
jgi:cell division protein FtsA